MTVRELIEALKNYDEDMEVVIQYRDGGGYYAGTADISSDDWEVCSGTLVI